MNTPSAKDTNPPSREESLRPPVPSEHESHKDGNRKMFPYSILAKVAAKVVGR